MGCWRSRSPSRWKPNPRPRRSPSASAFVGAVGRVSGPRRSSSRPGFSQTPPCHHGGDGAAAPLAGRVLGPGKRVQLADAVRAGPVAGPAGATRGPGLHAWPAAAIVTAAVDGRSGLRDLQRRSVLWRVEWGLYAVTLLGIPLVILVATLLTPGASASFAPMSPIHWLVSSAGRVRPRVEAPTVGAPAQRGEVEDDDGEYQQAHDDNFGVHDSSSCFQLETVVPLAIVRLAPPRCRRRCALSTVGQHCKRASSQVRFARLLE